jgi:hypothetical protein
VPAANSYKIEISRNHGGMRSRIPAQTPARRRPYPRPDPFAGIAQRALAPSKKTLRRPVVAGYLPAPGLLEDQGVLAAASAGMRIVVKGIAGTW